MQTIAVVGDGAKSRAEDATKTVGRGLSRESSNRGGQSRGDGDEDGGGAHIC